MVVRCVIADKHFDYTKTGGGVVFQTSAAELGAKLACETPTYLCGGRRTALAGASPSKGNQHAGDKTHVLLRAFTSVHVIRSVRGGLWDM